MPFPSRYNLLLPLQEGDQQILVFNTLRGTAAILQAEEADPLLEKVRPGSGSKLVWRRFEGGQADISTPLPVSYGSMETLMGLGMVVESIETEEASMSAFLHAYWHPRCLKITMAYTAACQMACGYCFQSARNLKDRHTPHLFQATVAFLEHYLSTHPELERIHLGLFGGEPLLDVGMASAYIEQVQGLALKYSLELDISLTTNGLNLSRELVLKWRPKGLKYVRVTLDGAPRVHDQRRPGRGGRPTFQRILSNLRQLRDIQGFGIGVSVNLDQGNADSIGELLDILVEAELQTEVEILLETTLPVQSALCPAAPLEDHGGQGRRLAGALEQVMLRGFRTPLYPGLCIPCNFVQSNNFIIDWSGQLFRCTFTMLDPQATVGSVTQGVSSHNESMLQSRQAVAYCQERQCAYLPLCGGGCRYEAALRSGDWSGHNCPVDFWDEVLPLSIPYNLGVQLGPKISHPG